MTRVFSSPEQRAFSLSLQNTLHRPIYPSPFLPPFHFLLFLLFLSSLLHSLHSLRSQTYDQHNKLFTLIYQYLFIHHSSLLISKLNFINFNHSYMASSENLPSIEPWMLRPAVTDSWLAEYLARDTDTLTKALQKSLSAVPDNNLSPFLVKSDSPVAATTPTVSSLSGGSDQESAPRRRNAVAPTGKISKRKSRASKRSQTTFITADPANFRQMVQQVTGVRFGGGGVPMAAAVVKPEPQRAVGVGGGRLPAGAGCLPTLDTSAFLLDQVVVGPNSGSAGPVGGLSGPGPLAFAQTPGGTLDAHHGASLASAGLDFDSFSSFPTLESWKVM